MAVGRGFDRKSDFFFLDVKKIINKFYEFVAKLDLVDKFEIK